MYNKLFSKILDSSIWLAPDPHRLVWITFLAAMDEDGNAMFASAANVAARARVTREQAEAAIASFEGPDPDSGDQDNEGRRIERFPGGWHILNAAKYRSLVTKAIIREQTRIRVARHREKRNGTVTHEKREPNAPVTPSLSLSVSVSEALSGSTADPPLTARHSVTEDRAQTPMLHGSAKKRAAVRPASANSAEETALQAACRATWQSYSNTYQDRYGVRPVRNAKVNSLVKQFCQQVPADEAPAVAADYVRNNSQFYTSRGHALQMLVADAAKLRTEWATGVRMTATRARQIDKTGTMLSIVEEIERERGQT